MTAHLHYRHTCTRRSPSQIRLAGLVVACAFGDIKRLMWSKSEQRPGNQPANTQAQAGTTVRRSTREMTGDGRKEDSTSSPGSEQKIERLEAPQIYKSRVVVRVSTSDSLCAARKRYAGNTWRCKFKASSYVV